MAQEERVEGTAQYSAIEWAGDARDKPLPSTREAAVRRACTASKACRTLPDLEPPTLRQPLLMHHVVTADAHPAVEPDLHA